MEWSAIGMECLQVSKMRGNDSPGQWSAPKAPLSLGKSMIELIDERAADIAPKRAGRPAKQPPGNADALRLPGM